MTTRNAVTNAYFFGKSACAVLVLLLAIPKPGTAQQSAFTDTLEAPFWVLTQEFGTVTLSNDVNHSTNGTQALKFTSLPGGERYMHATRTFSSRAKGTFSVWFYDTAPGQETMYEGFSISDSVSGWNAVLGTQDFDAYCYKAFLYNSNTTQTIGPSANCGNYPNVETTPVLRTPGWHNFKIVAGALKTTLFIDGVAVFASKGSYLFDSLDLSVVAPNWRPDTVAYFDDLVVKPLP